MDCDEKVTSRESDEVLDTDRKDKKFVQNS